MKRNLFKLISAMLVIIMLTTTSAFALTKTSTLTLTSSSLTNTTIAPNVFINDIDVSGMTKAEALSVLKFAYDSQLNNCYLTLVYGANKWRLDYKTFSATYNYTKAVDEALAIVRQAQTTTDGGITTTDSSITPDIPRVNISLTITYNKKNLNGFLTNISKKIYLAPVDATMKISGKTFTIIDGKNGRSLNITDAENKISKSLSANNTINIALTATSVPPKYNKNNLLDVKDRLGTYTTKFNASDVDRVTNIKVAAKNINNFIIMPNETFSVNKTIGPRLEATGFKLAHVILGNKLVDGIGGGVCQVSTTLYNAVLLANLKIVERTHHTLPSTYVSLGRDATISGDYKDLKFQNNTTHPIYITNEVVGGHITFSIYGKNDFPSRKVKIKTQILSVTRPKTKTVNDPTLPKGKVVWDTKPYSAYTVKSFREVYEKGKLLYIEELFTDKYPLINGIKKVGTKI